MTLEGKVAIITGGSRGIGAACSTLLAARGAAVVFSYLNNAARAEQLVTQIRAAGGKAQAVQADVRDTAQTQHLVDVALQAHQHVDILVSNAPAGWMDKPFTAMTWEEYYAVVEAELRVAFDITKAVLPTMRGQQNGRLIYISSGLAHHPIPGSVASSSGKAALNAMMRSLAFELGVDGITANAVSPGMVTTEINAFMPEVARQRIAALTPLKRVATPADIAGVVAFLAGDDSQFVTGATINASGGFQMD